MKKILLLLTIVSLAYNCKTQIISLEEANPYFLNEVEGIPDNVTSVKDINHKLDEFLGVWTLNYDSKHYEFFISKVESTLITVTIDILLIKHGITDENGIVIEDTTNLPNDSASVMSGRFFLEDNESYLLSYLGSKFNCGQFGDVIIHVDNVSLSGNQMLFQLVPGHKMIDPNECAEPWTFPFPKDIWLTLIKQ